MINKPNLFGRLAASALAAVVAFVYCASSTGQESSSPALTPSQVAAIKKKLEELKTGLTDLNLQKNGSAEQVFRAAAADPKKAVDLYMKCEKELNFTRLGKKESDFRDWKEANEERIEFGPFVKALQLQLHYLSLAARAAQQEEISTVFGDLTTFMRQLQTLDEPPHPYLNSDISGSVFAEVYNLDAALKRKEDSWELNPMNIGGVYEKTIFPYLREAKLYTNLDKAWESRIQQQTNMAQVFLQFEESMERYQERNEGERAVRNELGRMAQFVRAQAKRAERFEEDTLPRLKWARAKDQFMYSNQAFGAKSMLEVIEQNLSHDNAGDWMSELNSLVQNSANTAGGAAVPATPAGS